MRRVAALVCLAVSVSAATAPAVRAGDDTMTFEAGCGDGETTLVAAVGDLLFHKKLQVQAYAQGGSFSKFWAPVAGFLSGADVTYGNFEAPSADGVSMNGNDVPDPGRVFDGLVYSATLETLSFNVHPSVLDDIKEAGFDVLSTANNHAYDRGPLGIDRTVDNMQSRAIAFTGTRSRERMYRRWSTLTRSNGFTIAWVACTFSTNGPRDRFGQVLECYGEREDLLAEISTRSREYGVDAVVFTPHWGEENSLTPNRRETALAHEAIEAGATAVIGAHPHVVQPWERFEASDGRQGLIIYSTGNFISNQRRTMQRAGMIALVEFVRGDDGRAAVGAAGFVPTWVVIDNQGHKVTVNDTPGGRPNTALREMLRLLPAGNRVAGDTAWPPALPRACPADGAVSRLPAD